MTTCDVARVEDGLRAVVDLKWSASEKKIARRAFEAALDKAIAMAFAEFKARAAAVTTPAEMWGLGDDLYRKRREIDRMFDYRYSQLPLVFATLIHNGYLDEAQLSGLSEEKLEFIRDLVSWDKKHSPS